VGNLYAGFQDHEDFMVRALPLLTSEQMNAAGGHGVPERFEMSRPSLARVQATKKDQKGNMLNSLVMLSPFAGVYPEPNRRADVACLATEHRG